MTAKTKLHIQCLLDVACGSSISRYWLSSLLYHLLSFVSQVSVAPICRLQLRYLSSISLLWLQYLSLLVTPLLVLHGSSLQYLLWFVSPASICRSLVWLQYLLAFMYLSLVAPAVAPLVVPCGSSIIFCRSSSGSGCRLLVLWLQYLLIAHGSSSISPVVRGSSR